MPNHSGPTVRHGLKLLLRYLWPQRWRWLGLMLLSLVMVAANLLDPLILKALIDNVLIPRNWQLIGWVIAAFITARLAGHLLVYVYGVAYGRFLQKVIAHARDDLFEHIEHKRLEFFRERQVGDLLRALTEDIQSIRNLASMTEVIGVNLVRVAFMLAVVFVLSWQLLLVFIISLPFFIWTQRLYKRSLRTQAVMSATTDVRLLSFLQERISNIFLVKLFTQENRQLSRERNIGAAGVEHNVKLQAGVLGSAMLATAVVSISSAVMLWIGGYQVLAGTMEIGALLAVYAYAGQLFGPVSSIAMAPAAMQSSLVSAGRVLDILVAEEEQDGGIRPSTRLRGDIRFKNVSFAYPGRPNDWILRNVSLHIRPGERVAITGASGSGKSTVLLLLLGFYEPNEGEVLIDGKPAHSYAKSFLRKHIAVDPQVPVLFPGTVVENISFARPKATHDEIEKAAIFAAIHETIMELPEGYETHVGPGGTKLSQGEMQRIAMARAFLKKPDLYIFDEPTSALDAKNEETVKKSIRNITKGKTTILIAHHQSTIDFVDRTLAFSQGRIL